MAAKDTVTAAKDYRVDAVNAYLEGRGPLPDGLGVTAAEQKVEAVEAVVELVVEGANQARQRWARALQRADWPQPSARPNNSEAPTQSRRPPGCGPSSTRRPRRAPTRSGWAGT